MPSKSKRYDLSEDADKKESEYDEKSKDIDKFIEIKQLDEENPMERARKYDMVKQDPPKEGFMQVDMHVGEVVNDEGDTEQFVVSKSTNENDKEIVLVHEPFRVVDLNTTIRADIARCPSHVGPMLIEKYVQVNMAEKEKFKPEKRKDEFKWIWVVLGLMMLPGIILVVLYFL